MGPSGTHDNQSRDSNSSHVVAIVNQASVERDADTARRCRRNRQLSPKPTVAGYNRWHSSYNSLDFMPIVSISPPTPDDRDAFLDAVARSKSLHGLWVTPPATPAAFDDYLHRASCDNHAAFLIRRNEDRRDHGRGQRLEHHPRAAIECLPGILCLRAPRSPRFHEGGTAIGARPRLR